MKKSFLLMLGVLLTVVISGCGEADSLDNVPESEDPALTEDNIDLNSGGKRFDPAL